MSASSDAARDAAERAAVFSTDRDSVIAELGAFIAVEELRGLRFTTLARAGSYMTARLRVPDVMCAVALDGEGRFVEDMMIGVKGRWDLGAISGALEKFADKTGAPYLILGASRAMPWEVVLPFNDVYEHMMSRGVKILDLIEVTNGAYLSLLKPLSKSSGDSYREFNEK